MATAQANQKVFVSPGVYTSETDLSFVAQSVGVTTLGLVGETLKGPAFEPVACKMVAAALHAVAYQLAYGHATGSGIIDEDDLRSVANELKRWKQ